MATIPQPAATGGFGPRIAETAPTGTFIATCVHVHDQFAVERKTFDDPTKTEKVDLTQFYFGFKDKAGKAFLVRTKEMRISGSPKSSLFAFLKSWMGSDPQPGWDYCEQIGKPAQLTVNHKTSQVSGNTYAVISSIAPCIEQVASLAPKRPEFDELLKSSGVEDDNIPF